MEVKELGHVVLFVKDVERSRRFYGELLGWREVRREGARPNTAMFSTGRTHHELYLMQVGEDAQPVQQGRRLGLYHIGVKIGTTDEELRDALAELQAAGAQVVGSNDHGFTHSLYILDPDGNEVELYIDVQPETWREEFAEPASAQAVAV